MPTPSPRAASRFSILPGETPQEAAARLEHPSFAAAVEAVRLLLEIAAAYDAREAGLAGALGEREERRGVSIGVPLSEPIAV